MDEPKRTFAQIAQDIKKAWKHPYYGAKPYIEAMLEIDSTDPNARYMFETAKHIAKRFLANAPTFRGMEAKRLKAELLALLMQ